MAQILVVDDSPTILRLTENMLEEGGHEVVRAMDGEMAVQLAVGTQPDLILLDIILPKLNGYQVCRQLKSIPETSEIPVVMITRKAREEDRQWGVEQGANAYITKPFTAPMLNEVISSLLP